MKKFILLTKHTDEELTLILQKMEDEGLRLCKVRGNIFEFKKTNQPGTICATSFYVKDHKNPTAFQMSQQCVYLRSLGWDTLCTSGVETLCDSCRHIFLIKEKTDAKPIPVDEEKQKKVMKKARNKAFSNFTVGILYLLVFGFLIKHDLMRVVSSNIYVIASVIALLMILFAVILGFISVNNSFVKEKKKLRLLDLCTLYTTSVLLVFALFLFADSLWHSGKGSSTKIKIGSSSFVLYTDELPIKLEDLEADTSAPYRTSRKESSSGLLGSYLHCFDESFGVEKTDIYSDSKHNSVSYISYTYFKSDYPALVKTVSKQLGKDCIFIDNYSLIQVRSGFELLPQHINMLKERVFR